MHTLVHLCVQVGRTGDAVNEGIFGDNVDYLLDCFNWVICVFAIGRFYADLSVTD